MEKKLKTKEKVESKSLSVTKNTKMPEGIIIISVLSFLASLSFFSMAFRILVNTDNPVQTLGASFDVLSKVNPWYSEVYFVLISLVIIAVALAFYYIGRGLLLFNNKVRIITLVILSLGIVLFVILLVMNKQSMEGLRFFYTSVFLIIIQVVGVWYLSKKDIVRLFK